MEELIEKIAKLEFDDSIRNKVAAATLKATEQMPPGTSERQAQYVSPFSRGELMSLQEMTSDPFDLAKQDGPRLAHSRYGRRILMRLAVRVANTQLQ